MQKEKIRYPIGNLGQQHGEQLHASGNGINAIFEWDGTKGSYNLVKKWNASQDISNNGIPNEDSNPIVDKI